MAWETIEDMANNIATLKSDLSVVRMLLDIMELDDSAPSLRSRRWLFLLSRCKNPFIPHHWAAGMALKDQDEGVETQDKLARALVEVLPELADCVDPELAHDSPAMPSEAEGDPPMLAWDARAASYLEGLGGVGAKIAGDLRGKAAKRWQTYLETGDENPLWSWWNGLTDDGETLRFMYALATVLWHDRIRPQLEAPTLQPITTDGMVKVPKVVAPVSWAWGGGCLEAGECLKAIVQDGESYGVAPELARDIAEGVALLPKSHPLITGEWRKRPHQSSLPLGLGQGEQPLPVAMAEASAGGLLSPLASKLMLLTMADTRVLGGGLVRGTVDELARALYPNAQRIQPPARNRVVEAAEEMGGLHIYNSEALNMPRVFDVTARVARRPDGSPEPDAQIWLGFSKAFELAWPAFTRGRYNGEFLVNLTGALGLDNRKPQLLRHYIRACAAWNASYLPGTDGRFNPAALPAFKPEDWGAMVNTLSPSVVEHLQGQPGARKGRATARKATSKARKLVMNELECLAEQHGLIRLERAGRGKFKPLPPEGYIEAWERIRKAGRRPKG